MRKNWKDLLSPRNYPIPQPLLSVHGQQGGVTALDVVDLKYEHFESVCRKLEGDCEGFDLLTAAHDYRYTQYWEMCGESQALRITGSALGQRAAAFTDSDHEKSIFAHRVNRMLMECKVDFGIQFAVNHLIYTAFDAKNLQDKKTELSVLERIMVKAVALDCSITSVIR